MNKEKYLRLEKEFTSELMALSNIQNEFDLYQNEKFSARNPEFFCLELNGEAGELANLEKKIWKGRDIPFENLQDEAADVFIALMNYCNSRKIDLSNAVKMKLYKIENKRIELASNGKKF